MLDLRHVRRRGRDEPPLKIGLLSDTHESGNPRLLVERLRGLGCDLHVHLGDVGGAKGVMQAVRDFKRSLGSLEGLTDKQRQEYARLTAQGASPMRAYGEAVLGADPEVQERRRLETQESYADVLSALSDLANVYWLAGNVDKVLSKAGVLTAPDVGYSVALVKRPTWLEFGQRAIVLWPSMRGRDAEQDRQLRELVAEFVGRARGKRLVVVLGHEQLFKGPVPRVYKSRVEDRGLDAVTVPWFEPSPSWRYLVSFFRQLSPEVEVGYVFGHVHDAQEVIEAGIPHLRGGVSWRYRLYGLGHKVLRADRGRGLRRSVPMYYVPAERVAALSLRSDGVKWEVFEP